MLIKDVPVINAVKNVHFLMCMSRFFSVVIQIWGWCPDLYKVLLSKSPVWCIYFRP